MRKFFATFLAIFLITGFAMAQDDGIGLTAGVEFGIVGINKPDNENNTYPYLMPILIYENSFGAFDLYSEFDYTFGFTKDDGDYPNDLYWDLAMGYNLGLSSASTLSLLLENEIDITFAPLGGETIGDLMVGTIRPGVKFNQNVTNAGDFYAQVDAPIGYFKGWDIDNKTPVGLDFSLGWGSTFGFGLKAKIHTLLAPSNVDGLDTGYTGFDVKASYENGPASGEVEVRVAKDKDGYSSFFDYTGKKASVAIVPKFQYSFTPALSAYVFCAFGNIGGNKDIKITPAVGVNFSF